MYDLTLILESGVTLISESGIVVTQNDGELALTPLKGSTHLLYL